MIFKQTLTMRKSPHVKIWGKRKQSVQGPSCRGQPGIFEEPTEGPCGWSGVNERAVKDEGKGSGRAPVNQAG